MVTDLTEPKPKVRKSNSKIKSNKYPINKILPLLIAMLSLFITVLLYSVFRTSKSKLTFEIVKNEFKD